MFFFACFQVFITFQSCVYISVFWLFESWGKLRGSWNEIWLRSVQDMSKASHQKKMPGRRSIFMLQNWRMDRLPWRQRPLALPFTEGRVIFQVDSRLVTSSCAEWLMDSSAAWSLHQIHPDITFQNVIIYDRQKKIAWLPSCIHCTAWAQSLK